MRTVCLLIAMGSASSLFAQSSKVDSSAMHRREARATSLTGQVSRIRDGQPWALSTGDLIAPQQTIITGADGYGHFEVAGGSSFDVFANSRVVFRQNRANGGDLLDFLAGRVRIHLQPGVAQLQQRIFCPVAIITAHEPATIALAVDEDDTARIDVMEGVIGVQHAFLPSSEPVLVTAVDAVLVHKDQQISHQLDRGSLYRYTVKPLKDILSAITFGHSGRGGQNEPEVNSKFLAEASPLPVVQSSAR
ncbi:MAG: hypothetical protein ACJ74Z_16620 [Bryobacteraceae bacterium]